MASPQPSTSSEVGKGRGFRDPSGIGIPDSFRSELLFLMAQYLTEDESTSDLGERLQHRLTEKNLLQPRFDWKGDSHAKSFEDVRREVGHLDRDFLVDLTYKLCSISQQHSSSASSTTIKSLLSRFDSKVEAPPRVNPLQRFFNSQFGLPARLTKSQPASSKAWHTQLCRQLKKLRRTLGHLSSVYCLVFDRTGQFVFTGADDLLVKCWRVMDGRLIHTFRGPSSEISDLAISHDNRLLAAGSCDKIIRVWDLHSAAPVAVLAKHTGLITAIHFCPFINEDGSRYLASTSGDGTVSFWRYLYNEHDSAIFDEAPTRYHEKIRPGQAQMICASFSPGGIFFVVGSADHHVRIYQMNGFGGSPVRILEEEAHSDRVDSIQWCNNPDLRFVSGSKDGSARIWTYKKLKWTSVVLNMATGDNSSLGATNKKKKNQAAPPPSTSHADVAPGNRASERRSALQAASQIAAEATGTPVPTPASEVKRVTMVAWSLDDSLVITAVSDKTLKLWDSRTGQLISSLTGHEDEIFVLEPHPLLSNLLLSAAHDGQIIVWDMETRAVIFKHKNMVDEVGHAGVYDAKWAPDGLSIAASDSHGQIIFIGHGSSEKFDRLPVELFFHTDYRPLLRDSFHHVVDEQTQVPPHLLPPPFLVDSEGNPYEAFIQKFVPGRENMSEREARLPGGPEPSFNNMNQQANQEGQQAPDGQPPNPPPQPNAPVEVNDNAMDGRGAPVGDPQAGPSNRPPAVAGLMEAERNDESNASNASNSQQPRGFTRVILRKEDAQAKKTVTSHMEKNQTCSILESTMFVTEANKGHGDHEYVRSQNVSKKKSVQKRRQRPEEHEDDSDDEDEANENEAENQRERKDDTSDCSLDESDFSSMESTTEEESEHSDWGSDEEQKKEAEKEERRRKREQSHAAKERKLEAKAQQAKRSAAQRVMQRSLLDGEITDEYMPSAWLSESIPKKTPYFPQMGDVLMYFKQGHQRYIDLVKTRKTYNINMKEHDWMRRKTVPEMCLVKIVAIKFELRPPRLCVLELAPLNQNTLRRTGEPSFTIKYHDMNDVVDFLVLYETFKTSKGKHWKNGDRIRCQIDDCWWKGTVQKVEYHDANKRSPFLSIFCHWDNGEKEHLSPWDVEALDADTSDIPDGSAATPEQLKSCLYHPTEAEWNDLGVESESARISEALGAVMGLAIAEPFNYPVDLTAYPEYMLDVEYPMDLTLVKARIDNRFYRRIDAIANDVKYIATNAASFNRPRSIIVKNAKTITKLLLEILEDPAKSADDVSAIYHRLVETFEWSEAEDEPAPKKLKVLRPERNSEDSEDDHEHSEGEELSRRRRKRRPSSKASSISPANSSLNPKKWKHDCNVLIVDMCSLPCSVPFREPVSELEYPDYHKCITTPMDLATVRESLLIGEYEDPLQFRRDVNLIFKNSREYNTDMKAKIHSMTDKLDEWFTAKISGVINEWRRTNRRLTMAKRKHKSKKKEKEFKGKGKGKGKGQSNNIKKKRRCSDSEDVEEDDHEEDDDHEEEDDDVAEEEESSPMMRSKPRSSRARQELSDDDEITGDEEGDDVPLPSTSTGSRPMRSASATLKMQVDSDEGQGPSGSRRASSRVVNPPARYKSEDDADDADEKPLAPRTPKKVAAEGSEVGYCSSTERPKRQRKVLKSTDFAYDDDLKGNNEELSEEEDEDEKPLAVIKKQSQKQKANGDDPHEGTTLLEATPKKKPHVNGLSDSKAEPTDDEDDLPLAKKLSAKMKEGAVSTAGPLSARTISQELRRVRKPSAKVLENQANGATSESGSRLSPGSSEKRPVRQSRRAVPKDESSDEQEEKRPSRSGRASARKTLKEPSSDEEEVVVPQRVRARRPRKKRESSEEEDEDEEEEEETDVLDESDEEEEVSEDDRPLGKRGRKPKVFIDYEEDINDFLDDDDETPPKRKKRKATTTSSKRAAGGRPSRQRRKNPSLRDFVADSDEDEEEEDSEAEFVLKQRRGGGGGHRSQQQKPKANSSKRAAAAIDSESEHTSARRPNRLVQRNGQKRTESVATGSGRRARAKRTYQESDEDGEASEDFEDYEDSSRENRRPRRAAAAKKKRLADGGDSEDEDYEEEVGTGGRRPNPRII